MLPHLIDNFCVKNFCHILLNSIFFGHLFLQVSRDIINLPKPGKKPLTNPAISIIYKLTDRILASLLKKNE